MKKTKLILSGIAFAFAAMFLSSSTASAASACTGLSLPANVMTTILMTSTGCDAGGLNFSNFSVSSTPNGMAVLLSGVGTGTPGEVDLQFQISGFSFTAPAVADLRLVYEVKGSNITGVNNLFAGTDGTFIVETVCSAMPSGGACANGTQIGQLTNGSPNGSPSITFASGPQTDIWIIKDIGISAGAPAGSLLRVSDFTNSTETSGVPEPMTLSMMGAGLLGLSLISRRRKKS